MQFLTTITCSKSPFLILATYRNEKFFKILRASIPIARNSLEHSNYSRDPSSCGELHRSFYSIQKKSIKNITFGTEIESTRIPRINIFIYSSDKTVYQTKEYLHLIPAPSVITDSNESKFEGPQDRLLLCTR